jgi:hypothetical protein
MSNSFSQLCLRGLQMIAVLWALMVPALAQPATEPKRAENERQVVRDCKTDYARLCTPQPDKSVSGRDQATCLKYYKANLAPACRAAVSAVVPPPT